MTRHPHGAACILGAKGILVGLITDGDLRRMLEKNDSLLDLRAGDIMHHGARTIDGEELAVDALDIMRKNNITQLLVTEHGHYAGVIHLHDLVREGLI